MEHLRCAEDGHEPVLKSETILGQVGYTPFGAKYQLLVVYYLECLHCGKRTEDLFEDSRDAIEAWNAENGEQCRRCGAYFEETYNDWCEHCYGDMTGEVP